jgi:predicted DCC family thiol-disulfide oxidoreductase YuxK
MILKREETIPEFHLCRLGEGRMALVALENDAEQTWWGALSAGRRRLFYNQSRPEKPIAGTDERIALALETLTKGAAENTPPNEWGYDAQLKMWDLETIHVENPLVREFGQFCGRSTIRWRIGDWMHAPFEILDDAFGYDAVERLGNRWPFLQEMFAYLLFRYGEALCGPKPGSDPDGPRMIQGRRVTMDEMRKEAWRALEFMEKAVLARRIDDVADAAIGAAAMVGDSHYPAIGRKSTIRLLKRWNGFVARNGGGAIVVMNMAGSVPCDWLPRTQDEADAFAYSGFEVMEANRTTDGALDIRTLAGSAKGRWRAFATRLDQSYHGVRFHSSRDVQRAFRDQVVIPCIYHALTYPQGNGRPNPVLRAAVIGGLPLETVSHAVGPASWRILFGRKSLPALRDVVHDWHRDMDVMEAKIGRRSEALWHAPFDRFERGDLAIAAITSAADLRLEGRVLSHCVGGNTYLGRCYERKSVIASVMRVLADGTMKRLSTVEFSGWKPLHRWRPKTLQHHGRGNGEPAPEAVGIVTEMVRAFAEEEFTAPDVPPVTEPDIDQVAGRAGYDWMDASKLDNAIRQWGHFIPKDIVHRGHAWFADNLSDVLGEQAEEILRKMAPLHTEMPVDNDTSRADRALAALVSAAHAGIVTRVTDAGDIP